MPPLNYALHDTHSRGLGSAIIFKSLLYMLFLGAWRLKNTAINIAKVIASHSQLHYIHVRSSFCRTINAKR